jgi:hypothetical protein
LSGEGKREPAIRAPRKTRAIPHVRNAAKENVMSWSHIPIGWPAHLARPTIRVRELTPIEVSQAYAAAQPEPGPVAPAPSSQPEPPVAAAPPAVMASPVERPAEPAGGVAPERGSPRPQRKPKRRAPPAAQQPGPALERAHSRKISDVLDLYRICRRLRCRRHGSCGGKAIDCLHAGLARAPRALHDLVQDVMRAQRQGHNFDAALAEAVDDHRDAYLAWVAALETARP